MFGGSSTEDLGNTDQVTAIEVYDPGTGAFSPFGTMQMGRTYAAVAELNDGRFLLAGGCNHNGSPTGSSEIVDLFR